MNKSSIFSNNKSLKAYKGSKLKVFINMYNDLTPRELLKDVMKYLTSDEKRLLELYGLRRTGKTVLMFHAINELVNMGVSLEDIVYINCVEDNSLYQIVDYLEPLYFDNKIKYVFIDEITYVDDFISCCNILSDTFYGLKLVLTGTSSIVFHLAGSKLYDRYVRINTTYIPFSEWVKIKNDNSLENYIKNGGIISNVDNVNTYINEFINGNIRTSLENGSCSVITSDYERLLSLIKVYPNLVLKVTEGFNNVFTKSVLKSKFNSSITEAFRYAHRRLTKYEQKELNDYLENVLKTDFSNLDIEKEDLDTLVYLLCIADFYNEYTEIVKRNDKFVERKRLLQVQPTIRYNQCKQILDLVDNKFSMFGLERNAIEDILYPIIEGKLLEQIIMKNILNIYNNYKVFTYRDENIGGEVDIVIQNNFRECVLLEVKGNKDVYFKNHKWLVNNAIVKDIKNSFGSIKRRIVLYNGEDKYLKDADIEYINNKNFLIGIVDGLLF